MNPTPVAKVIKATGSLKDIHIINWIGDYAPNEGDVFFTEAQMQQARADALREAADNVNLWLPNMPTVVRDRVSEELRRMADEMEKQK